MPYTVALEVEPEPDLQAVDENVDGGFVDVPDCTCPKLEQEPRRSVRQLIITNELIGAAGLMSEATIDNYVLAVEQTLEEGFQMLCPGEGEFNVERVVLLDQKFIDVEDAEAADDEAFKEDDPDEDDPVEDDPVEDDPVEDDPVEDDPVEDDPVEDDPVEDDPVEDDPADDVDVGKEGKSGKRKKRGKNWEGGSGGEMAYEEEDGGVDGDGDPNTGEVSDSNDGGGSGGGGGGGGGRRLRAKPKNKKKKNVNRLAVQVDPKPSRTNTQAVSNGVMNDMGKRGRLLRNFANSNCDISLSIFLDNLQDTGDEFFDDVTEVISTVVDVRFGDGFEKRMRNRLEVLQEKGKVVWR